MQEWGKEWTKFIVPSTGSIIQVGSSVKSHFSPAATDSSPINLDSKRMVNGTRSCRVAQVIILWAAVLVVREILLHSLHKEFLHRLIGFGDEIDFARLRQNRFLFVKGIFDDLQLQNERGYTLRFFPLRRTLIKYLAGFFNRLDGSLVTQFHIKISHIRQKKKIYNYSINKYSRPVPASPLNLVLSKFWQLLLRRLLRLCIDLLVGVLHDSFI